MCCLSRLVKLAQMRFCQFQDLLGWPCCSQILVEPKADFLKGIGELAQFQWQRSVVTDRAGCAQRQSRVWSCDPEGSLSGSFTNCFWLFQHENLLKMCGGGGWSGHSHSDYTTNMNMTRHSKTQATFNCWGRSTLGMAAKSTNHDPLFGSNTWYKSVYLQAPSGCILQCQPHRNTNGTLRDVPRNLQNLELGTNYGQSGCSLMRSLYILGLLFALDLSHFRCVQINFLPALTVARRKHCHEFRTGALHQSAFHLFSCGPPPRSLAKRLRIVYIYIYINLYVCVCASGQK